MRAASEPRTDPIPHTISEFRAQAEYDRYVALVDRLRAIRDHGTYLPLDILDEIR